MIDLSPLLQQRAIYGNVSDMCYCWFTERMTCYELCGCNEAYFRCWRNRVEWAL